jgi:hypothetical protein
MTNIEMVKFCADAMRLKLLPAYEKGTILYDEGQHDWNGLMYSKDGDRECLFVDSGAYDPIHDDTQAMALIKRFQPPMVWGCHAVNGDTWYVGDGETNAQHESLNRAVVEYVAKLWTAPLPQRESP